MKKIFAYSTVFLLAACSTVSLTGRKRLPLLPASQMQSMSYSQYDQVMKDSPKSSNSEWTKWVKDAGNKIRVAVEQDKNRRNEAKDLEGYAWEFNLLEEANTVNAWCMPGGKVAFYTGIMPICKDEKGVAVVMGHEIAHAVARHGAERMSQGLAQQAGGIALALAIKDKPEQTQAIFMGAYGVASQYGALLPFSRLHESEADRMGLIYMAMAGYDPREAPKFWERMSANSGGQAPPEFLSTHPSHSTRIKNLEKWMPEALGYYNPNK
tara:strand:+ start:1797 stop:2597 length:801 start_codon:yes stop_codon:yes gene_type:complete